MNASSVVVSMKSAWLSKINWTQFTGLAVSLLALNGIAVPGEMQDNIAALIVGVQALVALSTWVLRTFFTRTVTPASATRT